MARETSAAALRRLRHGLREMGKLGDGFPAWGFTFIAGCLLEGQTFEQARRQWDEDEAHIDSLPLPGRTP